MKNIDIIVPIYEGYLETKKCIESLIKYNNEIATTVYLINDKSPNIEINSYLKNKDFPRNFNIIINKENLGFVKSVNIGMNKSQDNDIILLNSDTIVTEDWFSNLKTIAYINSNIATVTAPTNNGTIASFPRYNTDNDLKDKNSLEKLNSISYKFKKTFGKRYIEIPTCVGHCVYVKREILNIVGFFDEESFGKGYGEEVDFSFRVIKKGFKNVLALNTYILHTGSTSFKREKEVLIKEHKRILQKKHPIQYINMWFYVNFKKNEIKNICEDEKLYNFFS